MKNVYIRDIAYALPANIIDNQALANVFSDWTAEKIKSKTGIDQRHISAENETALDLAERACNHLFEQHPELRDQVDFLLLMTQSPDYILPPSSCILQNRLHIPHTSGAMDINLGCSAYIYGLATAKGLIVSGIAKNVLLVTAETYSKYINPMDKSTRTLFGDAATATWLSDEGTIQISQFDLGTDGSGSDKLIIPAGMARLPKNETTCVEHEDDNGYIRNQEQLFMDGTAIFNFTIDVVPKTVSTLLEKESMTNQDVDLYIFHQANEFMLSYLRKKLKIAKERFYINMSDIGNTVSCSIPIAIKRAMEDHTFPEAGTAMLVGFGVGLSWGSVMLKIG